MKKQVYLILCLIGIAFSSYVQATRFNGPNNDGFLHPDYFANLAKQEERKINKERIVALLQAKHLRLGKNSPAKYLDRNLFQNIFEHLNS